MKTPINSLSFSIGTARTVRTPPSSTAATYADRVQYSRICRNVGDVNTAFVATMRRQFSDQDESLNRLRTSASAGGVLCAATMRKALAVPAVNVSKLGVADADGLLQHASNTG